MNPIVDGFFDPQFSRKSYYVLIHGVQTSLRRPMLDLLLKITAPLQVGRFVPTINVFAEQFYMQDMVFRKR